jgi:molybdate transport system substrate-binding protein
VKSIFRRKNPMKTKILAMIMAAAMLLSLCACGSSAASSAATSEAAEASEVSETAAPVEETVEEPAEEEASAQEAEEPAEAETEETGEVLEAAEVQVFIAASLNAVFEDIIALYNESQPNVTISINADSSGTLQTQIEEGYACDIFFSAGKKQMTALEEGGFVIDGTNTPLLKNQLCLVTYPGSGTAVTGFEDLDKATSIALADGSVPVGKYTRTALMNLGILAETDDASAYTTEEVSEALGGVEINECGNVSKVAQAVAEGSNEVGTVYYSDYYDFQDQLEILAQDDGTLTGDIIYPVARITNVEADDAETAAADDFFAFLQTDEVMKLYEDYCFIIG